MSRYYLSTTDIDYPNSLYLRRDIFGEGLLLKIVYEEEKSKDMRAARMKDPDRYNLNCRKYHIISLMGNPR